MYNSVLAIMAYFQINAHTLITFYIFDFMKQSQESRIALIRPARHLTWINSSPEPKPSR